jgi:hypothetical protein
VFEVRDLHAAEQEAPSIMSRVERTEKPGERSDSEQSRRAERGRKSGTPQREPNPGHTPAKAEGELGDIEEALRHQDE